MNIISTTSVTWLMVLFPILDIYLTPVPGVSVGELLLIIEGIFILFNKEIIKVNKKIVALYLYSLAITIMFTGTRLTEIKDDGIYTIMGYVLYFFILIIVVNYANINEFYHVYFKVAKFTACISLIQMALYVLGIKVALIIPFIENDLGESYSEVCERISGIMGPFTEPAHLAQFLSIALFLCLFKSKPDYKQAIFYGMTMLLTLKGSAVVLVSVILGIRLITLFITLKKRNVIRVTIIIVVSIICIIYIYNTNYAVRVMMSRIYEIIGIGNESLTGYYGVSGYFRVKYGFDFFASLPIINKLFGIGIGSFSLYDRFSVMPVGVSALESANALINFRSGITAILIDLGLLGFGLYIRALTYKKEKTQLYIVLVLLSLQLVEATINTPLWILFMFLIFRYKENVEEYYIK